jgi:osmoprotectant transport system permease protein
VLALALYSLVILVGNLVEGLRAVPRDVIEAATAMGYQPWSRLVRIELPLATPALLAGLRAATVSTISLVSLGGLIGTGGLGQLFIHGFQVDNPGRSIAPWVKAAS